MWGCCLFSVVLYSAHLLIAIYTERALYADGANIFITLLSKEFTWPVADDSKHIRLLVNILNQAPLALGLKLGLEDLRALKLLFGAGLFLVPTLAYIYCYILSRRAGDYRVFAFSMLSLIACALPSEIFILNQAFTALSLAWIVFHYVLLRMQLKKMDWIFLSVISVILFRSHESLIFWGLLIAAAAGLRVYSWSRHKDEAFPTSTAGLGLLGLAQTVFVVYWQLSHPVEKQTAAFLNLLNLATPQDLWQGGTGIAFLTFVLSVMLFCFSLVKKHLRPRGSSAAYVILAALILSGSLLMLQKAFAPAMTEDVIIPMRDFSYRFLIPFGAPLFMTFAAVIFFSKTYFSRKEATLYTLLISSALSASSFYQISNSLYWNDFAKTAASVLEKSNQLIISPEEVYRELEENNKIASGRYAWPWAWTVLGLSLQKNKEISRIFHSGERLEAFVLPTKDKETLQVPYVYLQRNGYFRFQEFAVACQVQTCRQSFSHGK